MSARVLLRVISIATVAVSLLALRPDAAAAQEELRPTAIFVNGSIHTLDPERPRAQAIAVRGQRIIHVGSDAEVRALAAPGTPVTDLGGATVLPGLIDAHAHLAGLGSLELGALDLRGTKTYDEVIAIVAERAKTAKPGEWIVGSGWDHESWPEKTLPAHERLSAATPANPVFLSRIDGHAGLANLKALEAAKLAGNVDGVPKIPEGGAVLRDAKGRPTGILVDRAMELVEAAVPAAAKGAGDLEKVYLAAQARALAVGLTGVHDAGISAAEVACLRRLADQGKLKLRVYAMVGGGEAAAHVRANPPIIGYGGDRLTVRAVKVVADGAMGSRGAWLLAPYADFPQDDRGRPWVGLPVTAPAALRAMADLCLARGYQLATHAIGDRANREVLDAYEAALLANPGAAHDARFRVEHAQLVDPQDIPRFARLGVIASMQPTHATSDMRWAERRVGRERLAGAYAWAKVLATGGRLALGSDFPVEAPDPLLGIYAAVTRCDASGEPEGGWLPGERLTREEAVRGFTAGAAHAAFEEGAKGRLARGYLADLVVLSGDPLRDPPRAILDTKVLMTVIGGEVVHRAP